MKNILLVFPYNVSDHDEFENMIRIFEKENYIVHSFDGINNETLFVDMLPSIIDNIKQQEGRVGKIAVLSNLREIIFSWYRCFNGLVDDYIYCIDRENFNFIKKDRYYSFFKQLSDFVNIHKEKVEGKIYTNIDTKNYNDIYSFLLQNNNFQYFDRLDNYNFVNKREKTTFEKKYVFGGNEYSLNRNSNKLSTIILDSDSAPTIKIDQEFTNLSVENTYIVRYLLIELYKQRNNSQVNAYLVNLFRLLGENLSLKKRELLLDDILDYIEGQKADFQERLYILSLCVLLKSEKNTVAKHIMKTLVEDYDNIEYHYAMLYNTLFYAGHGNMKIYDEIYLERRQEIIKLADYFKKQGKIRINRKKHNKDKDNNKDNKDKMKIAIHYDQLLVINHSPTKLCLDLAKNLKKYYPEFKIKIFVEDNFIISREEVVFPHFYSSATSSQCQNVHKEYLGKHRVDIYYSNPQMSKINRTKEIVEKISQFDPDVIYTTSDLSVAREILYPYYPVVHMSYGGYNFSTLAHAYALYDELIDNTKNLNKTLKMIDEKRIFSIKLGVGFQEPQRIIHRNEYDIRENDFVLITVGNRLDVEMSKEFIDTICSFIENMQNVRWLVVGPKQIEYLNNRYAPLISNRKIIKISYEKDLPALYRICDVYANPIRKGGGFSIGMAMNEGLPVIVTKDSQDGSSWIGIENCIDSKYEVYMKELSLLYSDSHYRTMKGQVVKKLIGKRNYKNMLPQIIEVIDYSIKKFRESNLLKNKKNLEL